VTQKALPRKSIAIVYVGTSSFLLISPAEKSAWWSALTLLILGKLDLWASADGGCSGVDRRLLPEGRGVVVRARARASSHRSSFLGLGPKTYPMGGSDSD